MGPRSAEAGVMSRRYPRELPGCERCSVEGRRRAWEMPFNEHCPRCAARLAWLSRPERIEQFCDKWSTLVRDQTEENERQLADFFERILPWDEEGQRPGSMRGLMALHLEILASRMSEWAEWMGRLS